MRFSLKKYFTDVLFLIVVLILISRFLSVAEVKPMPVSVIISGSMEPTLARGDIVFWHPCKISDVRPGDIIVYKSYIEKDKYVVHRVIEVREENGEIMLTTKGDANEYPDQWGPHIVEPYIKENHLLGKVVGIGSLPLKIPFFGHLILALSDLSNYVSKSIASAGTPVAATPLLIPAIAFVLLLFVWDEPEKKKFRKLSLILGPEKVRLRRVFFYTFSAFLALMLCTLLFATSVVSVSVGVGQKTEPANLEFRLEQNSTVSQNITVTNDGFLPLKCVIFMEGDVKQVGVLGENVKVVEAGKQEQVSASFFAYNTTQPGVYNGKVVAYSSPFWVILPDSFMSSLLAYNPHIAILLFDIISSFIFSLLIVAVMLLLSILVDEVLLWSEYLRSRFQMKKTPSKGLAEVKARTKALCKKIFGFLMKTDWIKINGKKVVFHRVLLTLPFLPLALFSLPLALLCSELLSTIIFFYLGYRYRAEYYLGCATGAMLIIAFVYLYPQILSAPLDFASLLSAFAVALTLYLIFLLPLLLLSYICARAIFYIEEGKHPEIMFEGDV